MSLDWDTAAVEVDGEPVCGLVGLATWNERSEVDTADVVVASDDDVVMDEVVATPIIVTVVAVPAVKVSRTIRHTVIMTLTGKVEVVRRTGTDRRQRQRIRYWWKGNVVDTVVSIREVIAFPKTHPSMWIVTVGRCKTYVRAVRAVPRRVAAAASHVGRLIGRGIGDIFGELAQTV